MAKARLNDIIWARAPAGYLPIDDHTEIALGDVYAYDSAESNHLASSSIGQVWSSYYTRNMFLGDTEGCWVFREPDGMEATWSLGGVSYGKRKSLVKKNPYHSEAAPLP